MSKYVDLREIVALEDSEDEEEQEEYEMWRAAFEDGGYDLDGAARCSVTLIPEDEWENYARQTAEDIGAIGSDNKWPVYCIDWKWAARELAMDYNQIDVDGTTYYFQSY